MLRSKFRWFILLCLVLLMGLSVKVNLSHDVPGKNDDILPEIEARDEVDLLIQKASENFFFRDFPKATENYRQAIALLEEKKNFKRIGKTYESMGDMYKFLNNVPEAQKNYLEAVKYHVRVHNVVGEARAFKRTGDLYMEREQFDPALEWYQKAAGVIKDEAPSLVKGEVYESVGRAYWKIERLPEAIDNVSRAREIFAELKYQMGYDHMARLVQTLKKQKKIRPLS